MRHPVRGLLVTLGVIVLLVHAIGGWYYSGRIESDALAVKAVPPPRDLTVTKVEGDRNAREGFFGHGESPCVRW